MLLIAESKPQSEAPEPEPLDEDQGSI